MILMTVTGAKQGRIFGGGPGRQFDVLSFSWGLTAPYDISTGHASGKRQHQPVSLVLSDYENVVQLLEAIETDEVLKQVVISVVEDSTGEVTDTLTLQNAIITGFSMSSGGDRPTESLSFTYQKITWTCANKSAVDDWQA
jgi:type VI secretion system secreted protein Hcp